MKLWPLYRPSKSAFRPAPPPLVQPAPEPVLASPEPAGRLFFCIACGAPIGLKFDFYCPACDADPAKYSADGQMREHVRARMSERLMGPGSPYLMSDAEMDGYMAPIRAAGYRSYA